MCIVLECLFQNMGKVGTFGTIRKNIRLAVIAFFHCCMEIFTSFLNLFSNFWNVGQFEWRAKLLNQIFDRNIVKPQVVVLDLETGLWKVVGLMNEVGVLVIQLTL